MGVEWAYFVLILLEFASYQSDAKRALCDTQIFIGNEWLKSRKANFSTSNSLLKLAFSFLYKLALLQLDIIKKFANEFYTAYMFIIIFTAVLILKINILLVVMIKRVCIVNIY